MSRSSPTREPPRPAQRSGSAVRRHDAAKEKRVVGASAATGCWAAVVKLSPRREHYYRHAGDSDGRAGNVPDMWTDSIDQPEPSECGRHIDTTISRVHAPSLGGVKRKKPDEDRQGDCGGR